MMRTKLVVIGLDGASFNLLEPWLKNNHLPNLQKLREEGVWADMQSCLPPVTAPNWKCYSTGKNPGKLGVFWWEIVDLKNKKISFPNALSYHGAEIWDYMNKSGLKTAIINMPTTYPPKKVDGCMISGGRGAKDYDFTYPRELERRLKNDFDYRVHMPIIGLIEQNPEVAVNDVIKLIDTRFRVAADMLNNHDFVHITIFYINVLQHFFWDDDLVKRGWETIDYYIGKFMADDIDIIVMSDHGSNKIDEVFFINTWLEEEGYLLLKRDLADLLHFVGLNQERLKRLSVKTKLAPFLMKIMPRVLKKKIPTEDGMVKIEGKVGKINWNKSLVFASGQGPIYIIDRSEKNDELRDELIAKLETLRNPATGSRMIRKAYKKEEIYAGGFLSKAPCVILEQEQGIHIDGSIGSKYVWDTSNRWKAENRRDGIFIAYGSDIKKGFELSKVEITDLAPTILHKMGLPVLMDMDGRVIKEIFKENSEAYRRKIKHIEADEDVLHQYFQTFDRGEDEVKSRLKDLGYLS